MKPAYTLLGAFLVVAVALPIYLVSTNDRPSAPQAAVVPTPSPTPIPRPTATPQPIPSPVSPQPAVRLLIPSIGLDASIITLGVDPDGTMQAPEAPLDVAWYNFSSQPNGGGNVVLSGHFDFANYGPAIFFDLESLQPGAEVQLLLADGDTAIYLVSSIERYDSTSAPVAEIVGPTDSEIVTLITCDGFFDINASEFDRRLVVRAERQPANTATTSQAP